MKKTIAIMMILTLILYAVVLTLGFGARLLADKQKLSVPADIKPLPGHMMPAKAEWKEAYGDTLETQMVYNLAVIRFDQRQIFNLIQSYHPVDPNEVVE